MLAVKNEYQNFSEQEVLNIIQHFLPTIKKYAKKYYDKISHSCFLEFDDLVSVGIVGVLSAINKYDYNKSNTFYSYIETKIKFAIIDEIHSVDIISKDFRRKISKTKNFYNEYVFYNNEEPDKMFMRENLNLTDKKIKEIQANINITEVDFEESNIENLNDNNDINNVFQNVYVLEVYNKVLLNCLHLLTSREKLVLFLYYFYDIDMQKIANILGVHIVRVSQIHKNMLSKIRSTFEKYEVYL